jgi:hypothetical protein
MSKYYVKFQVDDSLWYQGGKLEIQQNELVLSFLGIIKEIIEYSEIIRVEKARYLLRSINILKHGKQIMIIPSILSYSRLCDDLKKHGVKVV